MGIRGSLRSIRKYWWIVVLSTLLGLGVGAIATIRTTPQYSSSVTFFVRTPADQIVGAYQGDQFAQKRVNSYVQLMESRRLAALILDDTQLNLTADEITSRISATGDLNTVLLTATVTDTSASRSLDIARSLSKQFVKLVSELETPPDTITPTVTLEVTSDAASKPDPVAPRPRVNLSVSVLLGMLMGMTLAITKELLDSTVRSASTIDEVTMRPLLAAVPFDEAAKKSPLIVDSHSRSIRAESYRQLRTNLQFVNVDKSIKILAVTSSVAGEGKSSTATNIAVTFAEADKRVLLIEGDLRRPRVADYLGLDGSVGLTNVLAGHVPVEIALQVWGRAGLAVLPSGSSPPNPSELLSSKAFDELLTTMTSIFDLVIIDTPPLLAVTDGAIAAARADGAILVVRHGRTTKSELTAAVAALNAVDARLFGSVLNMVPTSGADAHGYSGYGYYATAGRTDHSKSETSDLKHQQTQV